MHIRYFYDIICPYSWLGYQIIRQKLPIWKTFRNVEVEFIPFAIPFIYNKSGIFYEIKVISNFSQHYVFRQDRR